MDPVCHTLVGASLAATGLARKTRFGTATLLVAANLPDIDALAYGAGATTALAVRRGITHGLPALVVLPIALAATVAAVARLKPSAGRGVSFAWLLLLSVVGVMSHPALDWLNNYGMRWLMPFVNRWFYGDTLFIVDMIVWALLIAGLIGESLVKGRRLAWFKRPAVVSLALVLAYVAGSFALTRVAMREVLAMVDTDPPQRVMAAPVPFNPLRRDIVLEYADEYRLASVRFSPTPRVSQRSPASIAKGDPALLERAREQLAGRQFLIWARFPYVVFEDRDAETILWLADARYVTDLAQPGIRNFAFVRLSIPP